MLWSGNLDAKEVFKLPQVLKFELFGQEEFGVLYILQIIPS